MKTTAAVLVELGKPLELVELDIPALKPGQVLVEVMASGICHTQLLEARGHRGEDRYLPHCLGHEGTGRVLEAGPGVSKVKPDDRVILSWIKGSGADVPGTSYKWTGRDVNAGAITTFQQHAVISENRLTPLVDDIDAKDAAMLGCAVPTGVGSVINTLGAKKGQSIAIFGTGGVGLCAVMGAVISECNPVIAVDILDSKLEIAEKLGATHCINASKQDPVEEIGRICPGGVDLAVEASGRPEVMSQALESVHMQGGTASIIGNARFGEKISLDPWQFNLGKRLLGSWGGDSDPDRDFPRYGKLVASGRINLSPLISKSYPLADINTALDDLEHGTVARPIIDMSSA